MTVEDFENVFELAGYKSVHAIDAIRFNLPRTIKVGLSGGHPEITNNGPVPENREQLIDMLLENKSEAEYATIVTPYSTIAGYPFHHVTVEVFDFIQSGSGTLIVPYTPKKLFTKFLVHQPRVVGFQIKGELVEDETEEQIFEFSFMVGVLKNPEYTHAWTCHYDGQFLNDEVNGLNKQ